MTLADFFEQLEARIGKYDLLCHPFYRAWSAGELTAEDLREYARNYFHHVNAFPEYLQEFASRLPQGGLRQVVLANRRDELGLDGSPSHSELWLDFLEGMGGGRSASPAPIAEVSGLVQFFHGLGRRGAPEEALAAFYAYESQVPRVAEQKARGLAEKYGADARTSRYFTLHTVADVYHSRLWKQQLAHAVENNPAAMGRALTAAQHAAQALWTALDGIEAHRMARAA
jgi:pyrroloquinoline-quinone synthase